DAHTRAMRYTAAYLTGQDAEPALAGADVTPESSRRARGMAVWAAIRALGRDGIAEMVEQCCHLARLFAAPLAAIEGVEIVNDVVLNQVLVSFGDDAHTDRVVERVQQDGTCWCGATTWRGRRLMRISVSSWRTTEGDVDASVDAMAAAHALPEEVPPRSRPSTPRVSDGQTQLSWALGVPAPARARPIRSRHHAREGPHRSRGIRRPSEPNSESGRRDAGVPVLRTRTRHRLSCTRRSLRR